MCTNRLFCRKLFRVGENNFGFVLIRGDFAGKGDGSADVAREVTKFLNVAREDNAREGAGLVALTEVEKDCTAFRSIGLYEGAAHRRGLADV